MRKRYHPPELRREAIRLVIEYRQPIKDVAEQLDLTQDTVPAQFVSILPNVATLVVLALFSQRLRPPAADGLPWRKGERT